MTQLNTFKKAVAMLGSLTSLLYLLLAVPLAVGVARSLATSARAVLVDAYHGDDDLADAVSRLVGVTFCLLDVGLVVVVTPRAGAVDSAAAVVGALGARLGIVLLVLGVLHLADLVVLGTLPGRSRARAARVATSQRWAVGGPATGWPPPGVRPAGHPATLGTAPGRSPAAPAAPRSAPAERGGTTGPGADR